MEMEKIYQPNKVERKIYDFWLKNSYFNAEVNKNKKPFSIAMPPPNVTGNLHLGHAMDNTMQDILIRYKRMQGFEALWTPGTDHAAISTEVKVVEKLKKEGLSKEKLGRDEFMKHAWEWKNLYGGNITNQLKKLGVSCDWRRERFTMDEGCNKAVREFFVRLYEKGLIYRGERIINWCPRCKTTLSDIEVEFKEQHSHLWHIKFPLKKGGFLTVATTRPETMFGDTGLAVNPNDERYKSLIGETAVVPVVNREIPIIADDYIDKDFGTGVLKVTPGHAPDDFELGVRHGLPIINAMNLDGTMNEICGEFAGLDRFEVRKKFLKSLKDGGFIEKIEDINHNVGCCYRCATTIEPMISNQWFVKMNPLTEPAINCVKSGDVKFIPERFSKIYYNWMENIRDWCISRQIWWGHRIPAWYCNECGEINVSRDDLKKCPKCGSTNLNQDEDTLDTWFSSALWPFATLGWPDKTPELDFFFPTNVLVTGYDIIFFWVARMIVSSLEMTSKKPFENVVLHGLIRDAQGRKMSKSLGNGIDPLEIIEKYGADALRFALIVGNSPGNDSRFSTEKVESARNFMNKIWNAARFAQMMTSDKNVKIKISEKLGLFDKWILYKFNNLCKEISQNLDKFEFGIAAQKIYDFIWDDLCDWYIEINKILPNHSVLLWVLIETLKIFHPFAPFMTEEIYKSFIPENDSIMIQKFPEFSEKLNFKKEKNISESIMEIIRAVRNCRAEMNIPLGKKTKIFIESKNLENEIKTAESVICKLANATEIIFGAPKNEKFVSIVANSAKIYVLMNELVDKDVEKSRLEKEFANAKIQLEKLEIQLKNQEFLNKAPENIIAKMRENQEKFKIKAKELEKSLSDL